MKALMLVGVVVGALVAAVFLQASSPTSDQPSLGSRVDRFVGVVQNETRQLGSQIREGFREARQKIDQLGVEGRVYARLHWDKELQRASISVDVDKNALAVLRGTAPNRAAKTKATEIARDTVGVVQVRNDLAIDAGH